MRQVKDALLEKTLRPQSYHVGVHVCSGRSEKHSKTVLLKLNCALESFVDLVKMQSAHF